MPIDFKPSATYSAEPPNIALPTAYDGNNYSHIVAKIAACRDRVAPLYQPVKIADFVLFTDEPILVMDLRPERSSALDSGWYATCNSHMRSTIAL
jgi:hypothetical protein